MEKETVCKTQIGSGSQLHVGKILTPYNAHPKNVPLIK